MRRTVSVDRLRIPGLRIRVGFLVVAALLVASCHFSGTSSTSASANVALRPREACADTDPLRRALYGDLHVHTSYSMDAYVFDTRTSPHDAYRFARGEEISIAPLDAAGQGVTRQRIDRALDFAAVTDHAENLGPVALCTRPESSVYESESCRVYRGTGNASIAMNFLETVRFVTRRMASVETDEVCGMDGRRCRDAIDAPWLDIQRAAEDNYDRSAACDFTTFVAYEYSLSPNLSKVHRNVIFRNEIALDRPIHALDEPEPLTMLARLRDECIDGKPGCDVLAIPHNSNLSDGRMFRAEYPGTMNEIQQARAARLRASMEPVVEMMQIKGDSECRNGMVGVGGPVDELCDFEKMRQMQAKPTPDCEGEIGSGALLGRGCVDRNDFVRYALVAGLAEKERIGANPFQFGFGASTDEHDGTMGDVGEWTYGAPGSRESMRTNTSPGGLFGVYAEENSRDAIFDALRRKETFGTSGPRIAPRFFGGWQANDAVCDEPNLVAQGYAAGVPMGGILPRRAAGDPKAPTFIVSAQRDPGTKLHPGDKLERIQIIKGWVGANGVYEHSVIDAAGSKTPAGSLDLDTCQPNGAGHDSLCSAWTDPDFDPQQRAVYYSRVVEVPTCRWTQRRCNAASAEARPASCDDAIFPKSVQERAWTSPIWYGPPAS